MAATSTVTSGVAGRSTAESRFTYNKDTCHKNYRSSTLLTLGFSLFLILLLPQTSVVRPVSAQAHQPKTNLSHRHDSGICSSVDIRNTLDTFKRLEGCRVVEGFVQILLFDNVNETQLNNLSFPLLTEITDFFLLYRVNGLRSIGRLFPNLSVIRGKNTFFNYALVIFEMSSLQEIGLYSLTNITHGQIRIDKNPSLCFVNSINWDLIAYEKAEHFIKIMKPPNECPICPGVDKIKIEGETSLQCPKAPHSLNSNNYVRTEYLCWNRQNCQRVCPSNCISCNAKGECCNERCLGGCATNNTNDCIACQKYADYYSDGKTLCKDTCTKGFYAYDGRRCLTFEECRALRRPLNTNTRNEYVENPYKVFNGACILDCPTNYMNDYVSGTCTKCQGRCKKDCAGVNVDNIAAVKQLRGCTRITGSLEIQIRSGGNVVNRLEEDLSMIEEIQGYLKIVRSYPLVSLNFLKRLRVIHGEQLDSDRYAFVVLDNQNLQDLWDWGNRTLEIKKGRLFFHFNPKLCLNKIEMLQKKAGLSNYTDFEVASNSNGDKTACDVDFLNVTVKLIDDGKGNTLEWSAYRKIADPRKLLGYNVYLIKAPNKNVTLYEARDACGGDGWTVYDVANHEKDDPIIHPLTNLEAYTQYAFYVKTYTFSRERKGAQSPIQYFRTPPGEPTLPTRVQVISNASDALYLTWGPPAKPNGNITHYIVRGIIEQNAPREYYNSIDYCTSPSKHTIPNTTPHPSATPPTLNNDTCSCDKKPSQTNHIDETEEEARIKFEDDLQNTVYVKRTEVSSISSGEIIKRSFSSRAKREIITVNETTIKSNNYTNSNSKFSHIVKGTEFYKTGLMHYTVYDVSVEACRAPENTEAEGACGHKSSKLQRTLPKEGADDIKQIHITNQSLDSVSITWEEPESPNGFIQTYSIEYKRMDNENTKPNVECLLHTQFISQSRIYVLKKLLPGNYSVRVSASSSFFSKPGAYSPVIYFFIKESSANATTIALVVCAVLLFIIGVSIWYYRKRKAEKENFLINPSVNPEYVPSVYVPDEWEVPRKNIDLIRELGQGSFGMVYEGLAHDIRGKALMKCAVKTVNEHATNRERLEFLDEASVMKAFDTSHVVRLLGVVSQGQPTLVIMELMANGDLKTYLRSHRPDTNPELFDPESLRQPPTLRQIFQMAIEIADGMAYLSAKKFVHRDLAARNCMVAEDLTVKIGDFGMTRDIYETDYYRKGTKGLLPVRWMAPESLKDGLFTTNSDVWSYGVVLWEMATLASQPYQGLSNDQVLRYVIDGGVMERPENCPDKLYKLMRNCWQHKPSARPSFLKLCMALLDDANTNFSQVSFYHSAGGIEARASRHTPSPTSQDDPSTPLRMPAEKCPLDISPSISESLSVTYDDSIEIDTP